MRIAVLTPYGRHGGYSGPAESMQRLFAALSGEHEITVVANAGAAPPAGYPWAAATVRVPGTQALGSTGGRSVGLRAQLCWTAWVTWWLLRHGSRFDLVHLHGVYTFNLVPAAAAHHRGVPYVLFPLAAQGDLAVSSRVSRIPPLARLRRRLVSRAALGCALAADIGTELRHWGLGPDRVAAVGNPVDVVKFAPPDGPDHRRASRTLGFVGKLGARKGAILLLDVVARLHAAGHPDATAVFAGPYESDEFGQRFQTRAAELGLRSSVRCLGHVADVAPTLRDTVGVFVLPSRQEGLPGALVEAMAAGLPSVVSDVGSMGDVVRAAGAGAVVEISAEAVTDALLELWAEPAVWVEQSRRALAYAVEHFSLTAVAAGYLDAVNARLTP